MVNFDAIYHISCFNLFSSFSWGVAHSFHIYLPFDLTEKYYRYVIIFVNWKLRKKGMIEGMFGGNGNAMSSTEILNRNIKIIAEEEQNMV